MDSSVCLAHGLMSGDHGRLSMAMNPWLWDHKTFHTSPPQQPQTPQISATYIVDRKINKKGYHHNLNNGVFARVENRSW